MCQYFVLLSKNLSEYRVAMNTSYLQNPVTQLQLCHKVYSRICFLSLIFSNFPFLYLLAITVFSFLSQTWTGNRKVNFKDLGCQGINYVCGTVLFPTYINIKFLKPRNQGWHPYIACFISGCYFVLKSSYKETASYSNSCCANKWKRQLQIKEDLVSDTHIWN